MKQQYNIRLSRLTATIVFGLFLSIHSVMAQFTIPEKPNFQTSVYDYAKVLSDVEKKTLEEKLIRYSDTTTTQIVIITIEDLKGFNYEGYQFDSNLSKGKL